MRYQTPRWKHWRESHQPTSQEVAWSPTKFHEHRTLWEDKQTTAPTIFTGRRVQGCQVKTGADSKGFSQTNSSVDAGIETRTSRKWSATEAVKQAENTLKHNDIVGVTAVGRQGIGATNTVLWSRSDQKERRALIQSEVRRAEEHARQARAVEMEHREHGLRGTPTDRKLTWGDIWKYEPLRFSFLLRSVSDLLPSPAEPVPMGTHNGILNASLCDKPGTLGACSVILLYSTDTRKIPMETRTQSLRELADWLEKERKKEHGNNPQHGQIAFVKSGDTRKTHRQHNLHCRIVV